MVFPVEIPPGLRSFAESMMEVDGELGPFYPATEEAEETMRELRRKDSNYISVMYPIGPSPRPLSSDIIEAKKYQALGSLATVVKNYTYGEALSITKTEDLASKTAISVTSSTVYSTILSNVQEPLRLQFNYKKPDGSTMFWVVLFLAVEKEPLEQLVASTAKTVLSRNDRQQADTINPVGKTADVKNVSEDPKSVSGDFFNLVQALLDGDSRIQAYHRANRKLLGLEE
jgi:hypothetical protein